MGRIGVGEIVSRVETPVDSAGNLRGVRSADDAAASVKQNDNHDFRVSLVGVGNKPTEASAHAFIVARARLPKVLLAIGVVAALGRTVHNRSEHSLSQVRKQRRDIELLPHARLKILRARLRCGDTAGNIASPPLASVPTSDASWKGVMRMPSPKLDMRAAPPKSGGDGGTMAGLLFRNVVAHALPQSEQRVDI